MRARRRSPRRFEADLHLCCRSLRTKHAPKVMAHAWLGRKGLGCAPQQIDSPGGRHASLRQAVDAQVVNGMLEWDERIPNKGLPIIVGRRRMRGRHRIAIQARVDAHRGHLRLQTLWTRKMHTRVRVS